MGGVQNTRSLHEYHSQLNYADIGADLNVYRLVHLGCCSRPRTLPTVFLAENRCFRLVVKAYQGPPNCWFQTDLSCWSGRFYARYSCVILLFHQFKRNNDLFMLMTHHVGRGSIDWSLIWNLLICSTVRAPIIYISISLMEIDEILPLTPRPAPPTAPLPTAAAFMLSMTKKSRKMMEQMRYKTFIGTVDQDQRARHFFADERCKDDCELPSPEPSKSILNNTPGDLAGLAQSILPPKTSRCSYPSAFIAI